MPTFSCIHSEKCQSKNSTPFVPDTGRGYGEVCEIQYSRIGAWGRYAKYFHPVKFLITFEHFMRMRRFVVIKLLLHKCCQ
jgi:hypothetical protein